MPPPAVFKYHGCYFRSINKPFYNDRNMVSSDKLFYLFLGILKCLLDRIIINSDAAPTFIQLNNQRQAKVRVDLCPAAVNKLVIWGGDIVGFEDLLEKIRSMPITRPRISAPV